MRHTHLIGSIHHYAREATCRYISLNFGEPFLTADPLVTLPETTDNLVSWNVKALISSMLTLKLSAISRRPCFRLCNASNTFVSSCDVSRSIGSGSLDRYPLLAMSIQRLR